jgi:ribosomal protein L5
MSTVKYTARLADKYSKEVVPALMKKFAYKTVMQAPKLEKICINRGVNGAVTDKKLVDIAVEELNTITGLDITFVTTAGTNEEAYELLKELGMPFKNAKKENN